MTWSWEYFSQIGYASVLLWGAAALLCLIYWIKPARLFGTLALGLAVAAFVCAKINSETYVNRIQLDRSEELAKQEALEEAKRRELLESRGEEVAQIRFAEDGTGDFLDRAGMDESDLKYFDRITDSELPAWKQEKKTRSGEGGSDGSLESVIGGEGVVEGVDSDSLEEGAEQEEPSAVMAESDMVMANRLDALNLRIIKILIGAGLIVALFDYLRRANLYGKASRPLPLPSSWLNAVTPMPPLVVSKKRNRGAALGELTRLAKRGDSFVYLTDDPARAERLPASIRRFPIFGGHEDLIPVTEGIGDDFVFEAVWYGRSSFVVGSAERAQRLLDRFIEALEERKAARAKVRQTAHLVWDLEIPMPERTRDAAVRLAEATGFSILILGDNSAFNPEKKATRPTPETDLITV